jgi:hypothetical protein
LPEGPSADVTLRIVSDGCVAALDRSYLLL